MPTTVARNRGEQNKDDHLNSMDTAIRAAKAGGEVLLRYFETDLTMRHKGVVDLFSDADIEAERVIAECILSQFPHHSILGEEERVADVAAPDLWIIDPLDGTTNFAHRIPHFAVSVAYYRNGVAECGVILNPVRNDLYLAERGAGATHNGNAISTGTQDVLSEVLVGAGFYYDRGAMMEATLAAIADLFRQQIRGIRRFGTASLDLAQVASGQFGAYFEYQLSPWDFAAGRLLVEEAGGCVTTCTGRPLPLEKTTVLASNGFLHESVQRIVSCHAPEA